MKDVSQRADDRVAGLAEWARANVLSADIPQSAVLVPVSDDASFRRYFRFSEGGAGLVFVDAPPEYEDNESFVKISSALCEAGLNCPEVKAFDYSLGYLAVTDLGDRLYLHELMENPSAMPSLYEDAISAILKLLSVTCELPLYDAQKLKAEMGLFHEWFLEGQLGLRVSSDVAQMLDEVYECLVNSALEQPTGFVHRDFHSRNLMVEVAANPGIIDFQDAVVGPVTYDLVSLYKDCYYPFDRNLIEQVVDDFHQQLTGRGLVESDVPMLRWFDLMGAQRHLKCLGIFSRLNLRDGKPGYLADIPLVIDYLVETSAIYPELDRFHKWLLAEIMPRVSDLKLVVR
jgi:aminoglycoside/choline kinase family phosphotransferase